MDIRLEPYHVVWLIMFVITLVWVVTMLFEIRNFRRWAKKSYSEKGDARCCSCGKPYTPLNDPDYVPELNLCRDCLWKLHYRNSFGDGAGGQQGPQQGYQGYFRS